MKPTTLSDTSTHRPARRSVASGIFGATLILGLCAFALVAAASRPAAPTPSQNAAERVERGRYLVTVTGCGDCHTPMKLGEHGPEPDMTRMLSGHPEELVMPPAPALGAGPWGYVGAATNTAFAGPWGVSFAVNLTPEENTGLGIWTEEIFVKTLRTGRHWGQARPILPPMPWQNYSRMSDEDLRAMFAYLQSIPPIHNRVPEPLPPGSEPPQLAAR